MADWAWAQLGATVTLNVAVALAVGAGVSGWSMAGGTIAGSRLAGSSAAWALCQRRRVQLAGVAALAAAMLASAAVLWLESAAMAEVALAQAAPAVWAMLATTHLGLAWQIGIGALALALCLGVLGLRGAGAGTGGYGVNLLALAVFLYTRSMVSHAAADGDVGVPVLVDWLHGMLACLWAGEVAVAAWVVRVDDSGVWPRYAAALSATATCALAGIVATGLFSAWHNLGGVAALLEHAYGTLLLVKLALVAVAAMLGGANRCFVMPSLAGGHAAAAARRFMMILQVESVVLLGVLVLAAMLGASAPPTAG